MDENIMITNSTDTDPNLLRILDRGIDDIEAGRTLPHAEAIAEVRRIRDARRESRQNVGVAVNGAV